MDKEIDSSGKVYFTIGSNVPTGRFEYKFVVDGNWVYDSSEGALIVDDKHGSFNNYIEVLIAQHRSYPRKHF